MATEFSDQALLNRWEQFFSEWGYIPKIHSLVDTYPDTKSLEVSYWDVSRFDSELAEYILANPERSIELAQQAIMNHQPPDAKVPLYFRLIELPSEVHKIEIRDLRANHLGKYIAIEGLVGFHLWLGDHNHALIPVKARGTYTPLRNLDVVVDVAFFDSSEFGGSFVQLMLGCVYRYSIEGLL